MFSDGRNEGQFAASPTAGNPMSGPAHAGLFIYAKDVFRLADFYETLLGMQRLHVSAELVVLQSPGMQLVLHAMPPQYASSVSISSPPQRRENTALKFFFTVASIEAAREVAARLGGEVLPEQWPGRGFRARNAIDPEGNVFQLRERDPT
ncbi:VOC family protein [Arenimonas sp.]|uniref:VOC family protein n=1 Tax=Arenimonas sp. TaxID=1872635 RepID=UPI0039E312FA